LSIITAYYFAYCTSSRGLPFQNPLFFNQDSSSQPPQGVSENPSFIRRIVAVGDLHGDFPNAQKVMKMAGVVDEQGDWSGNVDWLVQTGDIIDR
jgi:Calcineurin-like phosphoesterase